MEQILKFTPIGVAIIAMIICFLYKKRKEKQLIIAAISSIILCIITNDIIIIINMIIVFSIILTFLLVGIFGSNKQKEETLKINRIANLIIIAYYAVMIINIVMLL